MTVNRHKESLGSAYIARQSYPCRPEHWAYEWFSFKFTYVQIHGPSRRCLLTENTSDTYKPADASQSHTHQRQPGLSTTSSGVHLLCCKLSQIETARTNILVPVLEEAILDQTIVDKSNYSMISKLTCKLGMYPLCFPQAINRTRRLKSPTLQTGV